MSEWQFHREKIASCDVARDLTQEFSAALRHEEIDPGLSHRLLVVLSELVNNAFLHGYQGNETGTIRLSVVGEKDGVTLRVEDEGIGMADLDGEEAIAEKDGPVAAHGRGLAIVREMTDHLIVEKLSPGTSIEVHFRLGSTDTV